jgi:hypothetical protein
MQRGKDLLPLREKVPVGLVRPAEEGEVDDWLPSLIVELPLSRPFRKRKGHPLPQGERVGARATHA